MNPDDIFNPLTSTELRTWIDKWRNLGDSKLDKEIQKIVCEEIIPLFKLVLYLENKEKAPIKVEKIKGPQPEDAYLHYSNERKQEIQITCINDKENALMTEFFKKHGSITEETIEEKNLLLEVIKNRFDKKRNHDSSNMWLLIDCSSLRAGFTFQSDDIRNFPIINFLKREFSNYIKITNHPFTRIFLTKF
jgi:hypothetical protein